MEINVDCKLLRKSSLIKRIFLIYLSLSVCQVLEAAEECDFIKCLADVKSFFGGLRKPGTPFICKNLLSSYCSETCMYQYFPKISLISDKNHLNFAQYCNENIANSIANWSCIAAHTFELLTCLANVSSLTSYNVHEDIVHTESCRKSLEFQSCPRNVISDCGENSLNVVKDILQFISNNVLHSCKGIDKKKVTSMPVHYRLGFEYMEASKAIDFFYNFISGCFDQLIRDEYDMDKFLCGENDHLSKCVTFELSVRNKHFPAVRRLLLEYFLLGDFKCRQTETDLKDITDYSLNVPATSTRGFNDDYGEKGNSVIQNSSTTLEIFVINNYFKVSTAFSLHYDRTLFILLFTILIFMCMKHSL